MSGILFIGIGLAAVVYGVLIIVGVVKTKDGDIHSRIAAGSRSIIGGVAFMGLGTMLYLSR